MILFIHRKDLRISDLPAFEWIRKQQRPSLHVLIIDPSLVGSDRYHQHSGKTFLKHVNSLKEQYQHHQAHLHVLFGNPKDVLLSLLQSHPIDTLVFHADYTPYAIERDRSLIEIAHQQQIELQIFDDLSLMHIDRFQQFAGKTAPYQVFTPFYRKWSNYLAMDASSPLKTSIAQLQTSLLSEPFRMSNDRSFQNFPFNWSEFSVFEETPQERLRRFFNDHLHEYSTARDFYATDSCSNMSIFTNSGVISARELYFEALKQPSSMRETWIRQLAWRDFYLYQAQLSPDFFRFELKFDLTLLEPAEFSRWCTGTTGIPVIDAAMRQLNTTGEMPNRLRMVTAMFLTKNMQCPFTWGEQYFRIHLADYDNILNRGGWLWSSSFGYDASPYFRIMNPVTQSQRFDAGGTYLRRWMPELRSKSDKEIHLPYGTPVVDLASSRVQAIEKYKLILGGARNDTTA